MKKYFLKTAVLFIAALVCFSCVSTGATTGATGDSDTTAKADEMSMFAPVEPPAGVIAVNDNTLGTGIDQFEYSGKHWNYAPGDDAKFENDDHYSGVLGAYFQVRFSGTNIKVYGTRDQHHGDAMATIDGGDKVKVTYKGAKREFQYLIFDSGKLSPGEHILKVTVVGNGVVTADRVDITQ